MDWSLSLLSRHTADKPWHGEEDIRPGRKGGSRDEGREGDQAPDVTSATTTPQGPPGHGNLALLHPNPPPILRPVPPPAWDLFCLAGTPALPLVSLTLSYYCLCLLIFLFSFLSFSVFVCLSVYVPMNTSSYLTLDSSLDMKWNYEIEVKVKWLKVPSTLPPGGKQLQVILQLTKKKERKTWLKKSYPN